MDQVSEIWGKEFKSYKWKDLIQAIQNYYKENFGGVVYRKWQKINLSKKWIKSSISHNPSDRKNAAFMSVPDIIKNGQEVNFVENRKGNWLDSRVYAAPIKIWGNRYIWIVSVNEVPWWEWWFYLHHVVPEKDL